MNQNMVRFGVVLLRLVLFEVEMTKEVLFILPTIFHIKTGLKYNMVEHHTALLSECGVQTNVYVIYYELNHK